MSTAEKNIKQIHANYIKIWSLTLSLDMRNNTAYVTQTKSGVLLYKKTLPCIVICYA